MTQVFDPETGGVTPVTVIAGRPVPGRPGEDAGDGRLRRRAARVRRRRRTASSRRASSATSRSSRSARTASSSSSAAASTAPSRARPSPSRSSSRATRSRSPASASARASRARSSATTSAPARARTARTTSASRARSARRRRRRASSRASRWPGRMGGKRVTQLGLTVHEVDVEQQPAARQGRRSRPEERHRGGARLMAAPRHPSSATGGSEDVTLDEVVFAAEVKPHLVHEAVRAEQNAQRAGTVGDEEPRARLGRPREAVAPEGHRSRAPGHDPRAAVRRAAVTRSRRCRAPFIQKVNRKAAKAALRGRLWPVTRARGRSRSSTRRRSTSRRRSSAKALVEASGQGARRSSSSRCTRTREPPQELPQPRACRDRRARASSRSPPSSGRARCSSPRRRCRSSQGRAAVMHASQVVLAPIVSEKSYAGVDARQLHVPRASGRAQDADPPGRRGALRGQGRARQRDQGAGEAEAPRRLQGHAPGWKKAVVQLRAGDTIEIFEGAQI